MKLICGNGCGWEGDSSWLPSFTDILRLAADVSNSIASGELTPEDVIPSGRCLRCGGYAYQELPDPKTASCMRARLARLALAGTVRKVDGFQRPGDKAPGSIARGLKQALVKAEKLGALLKTLESSWLDWRYPNGERPDFQRLAEAWKQGDSKPEDFGKVAK